MLGTVSVPLKAGSVVPRFRSKQVSLPNTPFSCNYRTWAFMFGVDELTAMLYLTKEYGEQVTTWLQMLTRYPRWLPTFRCQTWHLWHSFEVPNVG